MAKVWVIQHRIMAWNLQHANGHGLHTMQFPTREAAEAHLIGKVLSGQEAPYWAPMEVDLHRGPCVPDCATAKPGSEDSLGGPGSQHVPAQEAGE